MENFEIIQLKLENFDKCSNIWDLKEDEQFTQNIYSELKSGNRITFIYQDCESRDYLGEVSIVFDDEDPYTIKKFRIYL